ncbi:MAG TPA: DUF1549 domain-containing protein, partial [Isosphaeraceae bacterium]|nr:DUF1549 domain-containing protein [Isosphaeraceae bacterium]
MNQSLDGAEALSVLPMDWRGTGTKIPAKARSHHWARGGIAIVSIVSLSLLMAGVGASMARAQATARGEDREGIEFYEKAIRPMLTDRCFQCHGVTVKNPKGGLVLETREGMVKGGGSGPAIVPGDPEASLLIQAIRYADEELRMPPRRRLAPEDVAAFEAWVKRGAPAPSARRAADRPAAAVPSGDLWAFRPPREPVILPKVPADYPIDAFIQAELAKRGLPHASLADRRTLLRRATYDLTGLPPRPEEIEAFLADPAPDAFAKVVDRLLASPRYGERWARHWLDLVRYTDEFDEAWRYRDWVVNAFNRDLPYDRFILHQIAGDLLAAPGPGAINADGLIATTVLAIGPWGGLDRQKRLADIVDDQIDTIGRSFLGLTVACARCHDHKFDPISTADYYGLVGFFFSSHIISDQGYLSHNPPRLKIPLAPPAAVEEHRRRMARVEEQDDKLQAAVEQQYAAFARSRRIMLSAAYQRSSKAPAVLLEADPENRLWGRMNRRRLDAEELHDGLLALAGRLKDHMGGPADPDPSSPRRLIYLRTSRTDRSDFGSLFDRANPALHVERRTISTVAPQALYLMNHPLISE